MFLICHVTSQVYLSEGPFEFMGGSSSQYVTTLTSLLNMGIVIVEI